jgi:hypothetical protein
MTSSTQLEQKTQKYWQAAHSWNTSSHPKAKSALTVAQGICLLDEARRGSSRLQKLADITINQIVHKQAEIKTIKRATVKEIRGG